jgi:hypothetical protein
MGSSDPHGAIPSSRQKGAGHCGRAQELLDRQAAAEQASASIAQAVTMPQPPADPLIGIRPGVRTLVDAALTL